MFRGHDHLLEIRLLEKSARHNFIIARHRSGNNIFSCRLLEIRAVDQFRVEQLICCQKCRANDCRAIEFRAVHPHSFKVQKKSLSEC